MSHGNETVEGGGWHAHERAHRLFQDYSSAIYEAVEDPLRFWFLLHGLRCNMLRHIEFENQTILPAYGARVAEFPPMARPEHFFRDHESIRIALDSLLDRSILAHAGLIGPSYLRHSWVDLEELLEHHDVRETEYCYPILQEALLGEEKKDMLRRLAQVPMFPVEQVLDGMEALTSSTLILELMKRFRDWTRGMESAIDGPLLESQKWGPVHKLLERVVSRSKEFSDPSGTAEWARRERALTSLWRNTIRFGLEREFRLVTGES